MAAYRSMSGGGLGSALLAGADTKQHLRTDLFDRADELVRGPEAVARGVVGIGAGIGKKGEHIPSRGNEGAARGLRALELRIDVAGTVAVMGANEVDTGAPIACRGVDVVLHVPTAKGEVFGLVAAWARRTVHSLERAQGACGHGRIYSDFS